MPQTQQQTTIAQPTGYTPVYHWPQPPVTAPNPIVAVASLTPWAIGLVALVSALAVWFVLDGVYGGDRIRALEARLTAAEAISADRGRAIAIVQGAICK